MRTVIFIFLLILSALTIRANNDLVITNGTVQTITSSGTYLLKGTESRTITLNDGITVIIKLENDVTLQGNIFVPNNSSLTINGANHTLTVSENIGGMNSKNNDMHSGEINIQFININAINIGGGNGLNGRNSDWGGGNGSNGGSCKQISISNSVLNIKQIGGGRGGNGGYGGRGSGGKGGNGGNGGNCLGNITIENSTINAIISIGEGKKGTGGDGHWGGSNGGNGNDGEMQNGSTIVPTNSLLKIGNETSIIGTYTFSEDLIVDNLEIKPSSNITISEGKQVYVNTKLKADNTVSVNGNIVLGSRVTIDGNFTNFSYAINILFKKDNSNWNDVDKTITLKYNTTNKDASWIQDKNMYSAICKFDDAETYNIFIGDLDTKQSINASTREIALDYYSLNFYTNYGNGSVPTQYLLEDVEHPTEPIESPTKQYYTFNGWSSDYYSINTVDFNSAIINQATTYYAIWTLNTFTVNAATKQELTYKQQPISYDLSLLLSADAVKNCGTMTYEVTNNALPEGLSLDGSIIKGSPNTVNTNEVEVTITATAANTSTVDIPIAFTVAKKELVITPVANQSIYQDEVATYEPLFETNIRDDEEGMTYIGKLAWDMNNNITIGNLVFDNYEPTLSSSPVSITIEDSNIPVVITSIPNINDWCTDDITLTAPNGFKISGNDKTRTADWQPSITISEEGSYEYAYSLLRDKQTMPVNQTISVKLDKTAPNLSGTTNKLNYTLTFSDAGSGIDKLYIDGAEVTLASSATTYTATGTAGTHTAKVTDKAGLSQEFSFELVDGGSIDPDPVPEPDPEPVYYDVRLVETEGVIFSPAAGTYPVEEYGSFSFSVTVAEGYREQSVPVVKVNGNVYDPVDADGRYKIKFIRSDQSVTVEGILADNPTANENLSTPVFKLRTEGHTLCITVAQPRLCRLFDPSGRLICSRQLTLGINRLEGLAAGIYFVVVEREGVRKIVVQ